MTDSAKVSKLIQRLQSFASRLDSERDLVIHQNISQFYYMEKAEELKVLLEQFEEIQMKLESLVSWIDTGYTEAFHRWRKDARWMSSYLREYARVRPVL